MPKKAINPSTLPVPPGFSRGVETSGGGRTIYISGAAPLGPDNQVSGDNLAAQAEACLSKIALILGEAGGSMGDIVSLSVYVTDISRLAEISEVREKYLTGPVPPAMSGFEVSALAGPDWLIEIDGIAYIE